MFMGGEESHRFAFIFDVLKISKMVANDYFKPIRAEKTKKRRDFVNANAKDASINNYTILES